MIDSDKFIMRTFITTDLKHRLQCRFDVHSHSCNFFYFSTTSNPFRSNI